MKRAPEPLASRWRGLFAEALAAAAGGHWFALIGAFMLLFGGIFLAVAWDIGPRPLLESRQFAPFTAHATGRIVESWMALDFDPADAKGPRWHRLARLAPCVIVEYDGSWNAAIRRAFCGHQFTFSDSDIGLHEWHPDALGIPFAWPRDRKGFARTEMRILVAPAAWLKASPPASTFMDSTPHAKTAFEALTRQFDRPGDVAKWSWSNAYSPDFALAYDPAHPEEAMPAAIVKDRADASGWLGMLPIALLLGAIGLFVWHAGLSVIFQGRAPGAVWVLTIATLVALPWWGEALPGYVGRFNRDLARVSRDMLDDITRTTRLVASTPENASAAGGERLVWTVDNGSYRETLGAIAFKAPLKPLANPEAALEELRAQASARVRELDPAAQAALFVHLKQQHDAGLRQSQPIFTRAAEDLLRDRRKDPDARRAARRFLSFAAGRVYTDAELDGLADAAPK